MAIIDGTPDNNNLNGTGADDTINGLGGEDLLYGLGGRDLLLGGDGNDQLFGGDGQDTLAGGDGDDTLDGGANLVTIGSTEYDLADYRTAPGLVVVDLAQGRSYGFAGDDVLINLEGALGGDFNDSLVGSYTRDMFSGGLGNDTIDGGWDFDIVNYGYAATAGVWVDLQRERASGGEGNDTLYNIEGVSGTRYDDTLIGNFDDNFFRGNAGNDSIVGGEGYDRAAYDLASGSVQVNLYSGRSFGTDGEDTLEGIENLRGSNSADQLTGDDGANDIQGRGGNDTIVGGGGADNLLGEGGNDLIEGGDGQDTLSGGAGDDTLDGGAQSLSNPQEHDYADYRDASGSVVVDLAAGTASGGGVGTDTLRSIEGVLGSANDDTLTGSADSNVFNPGAGNDSVVGGDGYDYVGYWDAGDGVQVNLATGVVTGGSGNDTLVGIEGAFGSAHDDTLVGSDDNNFLRGYAGNDAIDGGAGIDRAVYDRASGSVWVSLSTGSSAGADGNDTLVGIENLRGSAYNDTLIGDGGANDLQGRAGNDYLDGGAGADSLQGEDGEDTLHGGAGDDTLVGGANVSGQEFDYADYRDAGSAVVVHLGAGTATGGGGNDSLVGIEGVLGSLHDDTITGGDTDDLIAGGRGADVIDGGAGFDIVHYRFLNSATAGVSVNLASGVVGGGDGNDRLSNIEGVVGSDSGDTLIGSDADNFIRGNAGNDGIDGGAGADRAAYDRATGAVDVSLLRGTSLGADGVDTLTNIENLRGSAYSDRLEGDGGGNSIQGRAGNDLVLGQGGQDTLLGEAGEDTLVGGEGNDSLVGGDGSDQLEGGAGDDTLDGGGGTEGSVDDLAVYLRAAGPVSVNLAAGTATGEGNDTLRNINHVVGGVGNDTLFGDDNDNGMAGYLGDDVLDGGGGHGHDTLYYGDLELEPGNVLNMASAGVMVNLATGRTSGGAGNDTIGGFEEVVGSRYDDTLVGDAGDNTLEGGAGFDLLEGGAGDDVIDGVGSDVEDGSGDAAAEEDVVLYVHAAGAVQVDLGFGRAIGGDGTDVLRNIDNVAGSQFDDSLQGSDSDNVIAGWLGNDQMDGGAGFDRLYYGDIDDLVQATPGVTVNLATGTASGAAGNDSFQNFEGVIGSAGDDALTGNDANNALEGDLGNDLLEGAGGNDTLVGDVDDREVTGGGNDTLRGGAGDDWLTGGAGVDSLDGGDGWDVAFFENGTQNVRVNLRTGVVGNDGFGSAETIVNVENVHGGAGSDEIQLGDAAGSYAFGRGGNDRLVAGDAGSRLYAGSGADTLVGGAGIDTAVYLDDGYDHRGPGTRGVVVDLVAGTATDNWGDADVLSGIEHVEGSGLADRITGNDGDNVLKGGYGQDTLAGGLGNDTLDGGGNLDGLEFDLADYRDASGAVQVNLAAFSATGAAGNDSLVGMEGAIGSVHDDSLVGASTSDAFFGGLGNDTIDGGTGFDYVNYTLLDSATAAVQVNLASGVVTGGDGNDLLISIEGVTGSKFGDLLVGSDADNFFRGGLGDDTLIGGGGIDRAAYDRAASRVVVSLVAGTASGGDGSDVLSGIENLRGSAYDDELTGNDGVNDIQGRAGNDSIVGLGGADYLQGEDGDDTLRGGDQQDTLRGGAGNDLLDGGAQTPTYEFDFADYRDASGGIRADLAAGVATGAGVGTDTLVNIEGVLGSQYDDTLLGSAARDLFNPGAGNDSVVGGSDFDIVGYWDAGGAVQINLAGGWVTGAAGSDTLVGIEGALGSAHADLITGDGNDNFLRGYAGDDTLDGGAGNDRAAFDFGNSAVSVSLVSNESFSTTEGHDTLINIENLRGGAYNDTLVGNDGVNDIQGRDGNDFIDGRDGADYLQGEGGEDTLRGGQGNDTLDGGDNVAGQQFDYADYRDAGGSVTVNLLTHSATGAAGNDSLIGIEGALGGAYDDVLVGAATADLFAGGQGNDTIDGGDGYDIVHYRFGSATAGVQVNLGNGVVTGGDGNDQLISIEGVIGTDEGDALTGSDVDNFIRGNGGDDTIDGGAGNDRAAYDRANDSVNVSLVRGDTTGPDGHDTLVNIENLRGSDHGDWLEGNDGANDIQARGGNDEVYGLGGNDFLQGEAGNDTLRGGDGEDTLRGGAGDDLLDGGANALNISFDYADYRDAGGAVTVNIGAGTATGVGVGTDALVGIEGALGSIYGDTLIGSTARDLFNPGAGNDSLVGGGDFDIVGYWDAAFEVKVNLATGVVTGGSGDDTLVGFNGVLGSDFSGKGDELIGNDNNNFLRGYAGDDTIDGGGGQDRAAFDYGESAVSVSLVTNESFSETEGHDRLSNIEHLRGGSHNDTLEGNDLFNDIEGRDGNDQISGLGGNDRLHGEDGDDRLTGGAGDDLIEGGAGHDTAVFSGARADYAIGLTATGVQVVHLAGGEGTDILVDVEALSFSDGVVGIPVLSLALAADNGTAGDGLTSNGVVRVVGLADGVAWQYSTDAGAHWTDGSGQSFELVEGTYGDAAVQVRLTDAVGLGASLGSAVTVDTTAPGTPTLSTAATLPLGVGESAQLTLGFDSAVTGLTLADLVDSKGGSFSQLQTSDGGHTWSVTFTPNGERLGPASIQLSGAYTDLAGNTGAVSGTLSLGYAATATASDGYIRNADIYLDVNNNDRVDIGTDILKGQTGNDGSLAITLAQGEDAYDLLVRGGTDISTGQAFTGLMKAPAGSTMLSPLTTLLADLLQTGAASNLAAAQTLLKSALGLPDGVDLTSFDPLDVVVTQSATSSSQDKALALRVQATTLAVANLLDTGAAALQGAATTGGSVTADTAAGAVLAALVQQIATAPTVDLTHAGTLSTVLGAAAGDASLTGLLDAGKQADAVSVASSVLATANQTIADATEAAAAAPTTEAMLSSLSTAVAVQSVVQGTVSNDLASGQTGNVPTDRGELVTLTQAVDVSQLQLTSGQAATADTTPPATPGLALANDNGNSANDGISTDGTVHVSGLEAGAFWQYSTDGGANWVTGQGDQFLLAIGTYAAGSVQVRQADAAGNQSAVAQSAGGLTIEAGVAVDLLAYSWKSHTLLGGVAVQGGSHQASTDGTGAARWEAVTDSTLAVTASRSLSGDEVAAANQAIDLQDAIAVLRMVVGLDVNGGGRATSPYQSFAADFDADGGVGLSDAIAVLRHVVGLDAPAPQWVLFNEADTSVAARTGLQPGTPPSISLALNGSDGHLGLVGVLRGDVDGSYAGVAGAVDLDVTQPNYLASLIADKQLDPSQFGIYP